MKHPHDIVQSGDVSGMEERIPKHLEPSDVGSYYGDGSAKEIL